ncbi:retrovirus-related pol polyprotein from transposon TNT 1-94 [Tanacetum coccineum]
MYNGEKLKSTKLKVDLPDYEKTLEDAEKSRLKMKYKMIQLDYAKLNALYKSFVPQTEIPVEQTYFLSPFTSNVSSESSSEKLDLSPKKMPNESKLLKLIVNLDKEIKELGKLINISLKMEKDRTKNEMLMFEMEKISNESKDIQANLLKQIKILENDFQRSQAQSIDFELKLQHQKEQTSCDISWKSKMAKLNGENVSLHIQIESLVQEHEKIKIEYQNHFNSIKTTRVQHQQEVNELIKNINQKTYAYGDVRAKNQDLLMTIFELKAKIKNAENRKNMNTKVNVTSDKSKPVTSCSIPKNEQGQKKNANVIARGMYKVIKTDTQMPVAKANMFSCNSTGVASSSSVTRPESKDTNSKKRVLLDVKRSQSRVSLVSNMRDTMNSNVSESNTNVLKAKTVNVVHDGSNLVCISYGKDVFMISNDKCVARYALSMNSRVKRALFTSLVAAKSSKLGATTVVAKSMFSVANPPNATNKVSRASSLTPESRQSRTLRNYMKTKFGCSKHMTGNLKLQRNFVEKFMGTVRFGNDNFDAITGYEDYVQGNLTICHVYYVKGLRHNLFSGKDLLTGSRDSNLYTISISEMATSSPVCLISKATSTKSWLWHKRLSHLNFDTINYLSKQDQVDGLPRFKYDKDHLCSACEQEKRKRPHFYLIIDDVPTALLTSVTITLGTANLHPKQLQSLTSVEFGEAPWPSPRSPSAFSLKPPGLLLEGPVEGPVEGPIEGHVEAPLPINREAITKIILYSASPPSPPYDFSDHHRSLSSHEPASSVVAIATYNLYDSLRISHQALFPHEPASFVVAFTVAYNLYGSLRSSHQPLLQPLQHHATFVAACQQCDSLLCGSLCSCQQALLQPSQHHATFVVAYHLCGSLLSSIVAAFAIACNLCGSLRSSHQPLLQPLQQHATFVATCQQCDSLPDSLQPMWQPS